MKTKKPKRQRSAITGRFVTAAYAAAHPETTIAETVNRPARTRTSRKKK